MTQTNEAMETKPENATRSKALQLFKGNKNETFDKSTHQRDTTLKHVKDPDVTQRMAGHDIKPGIAGYRDRIALLQDAKAKGKLKEEVETIEEAHKLGDTVIMSHPTLKGVKGVIGEIRTGAYKGAPKTYTIDYQHPKHSSQHQSSIQLSSSDFKAHKQGSLGEEVESTDEGILNKIANKLMGAAPTTPKYKVGSTVSYEMNPPQKNGSGKGKITKYDHTSGFYTVNDVPVNHFEIKKVHESVEEVESLDEKFVETHLKSGKPNPNHPAYNKHKAAYDAEKTASKPVRTPEENPIKMHHIDAAISNSFPDVEPYDHLARKFPHLHRQDHATKGTKLTYWADKTVAAHDKKHKTLSSYSDAAYKDMHDDKLMGEARIDELAIDTVKSYKAKVATNPAPSKTTSDILHKAIRRFAGKERAEDRIHSDEMKKMRDRLGQKNEETLDERADREDDEGYSRTKDADDEWNKKQGHTPPVPKPTPARKRVPIDIWKKKPGVDEEVVVEDDAQKHMSNAMDNIHPDKRTAARKLYNSARSKGLPHAASLNIMHDRFGGTNEEVALDEHIVKVGDKYRLVSKSTGKNLGTFDSKGEAEKREDQVQYFKHASEEVSLKQIQREILEETGQLLSIAEVKYMVENAMGGVGAIAQHSGVNGKAPQGTGKVKKMMGNKTDVAAIAKIIANGAKSKVESN